MRKIIQSLILAGFSLALALLISGVMKKLHKENHIIDKIAHLPSFSFLTLTGDEFQSSDLERGPVLIVRFHPECDHCRYEISEIFSSDIPHLVSKALLISNDNPDSIRTFLSQFNYSDFPSVMVLADTSDSFGRIFGKDIVPSNYIYNKELKLVKVLFGEVSTETIRKYLQISE